MRYANIKSLPDANTADGKKRINIGDYIQLIAIDDIYREMGIDRSEIYYIDWGEIDTYVGEYLILPINYFMTDMFCCNEGRIKFSKYIIPVFIGVCLYRNGFTLSEYNIEYFKKYSPVGCRDYGTYHRLQSYGIPSYLAGCVTMTLPPRDQERVGDADKVYFVDAPEYLRDHVPEEYFQKAVFTHHRIDVDEDEDAQYIMDYVLKQFEEYRKYARLVITSRLHCAVPCMAMGIPVILAAEYKGITFDWINQFIPMYLPENVNEIDWNPRAADIDGVKDLIKSTAIQRIQEAYDKNYYLKLEDIYTKWKVDIDVYTGSQSLNKDKIKRKIDAVWNENEEIEYALWGISESAEDVYEYISEKYKQARLVAVYDTYREVFFHGMKSIKPQEGIDPDSHTFIIVISTNASVAAKEFFDRINRPANSYILLADVFMTDGSRENDRNV